MARMLGDGMKAELDKYPLTGRFLTGRLRHAMTEREKDILETSIDTIESYKTSHEILRRGKVVDYSTMLIEGFAVRSIYENDKRYIVGMQVPGDFMDLHAYALKRLDHDLCTIGPAKIARVKHSRLEELARSEPHLSRLFWFSTLLDASIHRQWILKVGQLKASRRTAHLFAEIWTRLDQVGLARKDGFRTPLTQTDLAEMCGTTPIHMNRALGDLRRQGIVEFRRGIVICHDRNALEEFGEFDPTYLYGEGDLHMDQLLNVA
ncbi:Crp/Fnr family transcriptional regulator [Qipengyuania sp. JC766]|uniref:Crp/Fnr family transcriptional regulator n=1 Tax=Qipengyuania sp. JC766 TaxID=3232139 RepID=UPI003458363B